MAFSNMADIDFYADINDDNPEDGFGLDDGLDIEDAYGTDDKLTPLQKLEKYMQSDNVYTRQMVARGLLDTLRAVEDQRDDCTAVLNAMLRLSEDSDPIVRSELMEQVPHLAVYCHENSQMFQNAVPLYVLPMVVRYLNDPHTQVRKTSQAALLVLLEQELIGKADIEEQVVSVILDLACPDSLDDYRTEAVALMSKMAPLLGKEMTERVFLPRYCEMCTDPLFHVRKVCAANFGDICTVVGQDNTEEQLLPKFNYLCEDGVWGVRKACAECFMAVSCASSPDVRRGELSKLFVNLLCDLSRWVRMAAFQQLGPFISTFADPSVTGLFVNDDGILSVKDPEKLYALTENFEKLRELGDHFGSGEATYDYDIAEDEDLDAVVKDCANDEEQKESDDRVESNVCDNDKDLIENMDLSEANAGNVMVLSRLQVSDSPTESEVSLEELRANTYSRTHEDTSATEKHDESKCDNEMNTVEQSETQDTSLQEQIDTSQDNIEASNVSSENVDSNTSSLSKPSAGSEEHIHNEKVHIHLKDNIATSYDSFQYWRSPLPVVDLDLDVINEPSTNSFTTKTNFEEKSYHLTGLNLAVPANSSLNKKSASDRSNEILLENLSKLTAGDDHTSYPSVINENGSSELEIHNASINTMSETGETVSNIGSTHVLGEHLNETTLKITQGIIQDYNLGYIDSNLLLSLLPIADLNGSLSYADCGENMEAKLAQQQDIVPQSLLESYLGMVDPSRAQTVDTEITRHCAYNLPAVAYTLGRRNWNCIKSLYEVLASDMQWKVRRTLAFSIHEMALILGEEITHRDIVPVFDGFLKDLDEVRIGVLKHLADFLRLLRPDYRRQYLTKVECFMNTDNCRNWRFRLELAEQLMLTSELYSAQEVSQFLLPLSLTLAEDKVAEVRQMAFRLLSVMMRRLADEGDEKLTRSLMKDLIEKFAQSNKWARRQVFGQLLQYILEEDAVPLEIFSSELLPSLFSLCLDTVPNVRISVAKTMSRSIFLREYFTSPKNPFYEELCKALQKLQSDNDRDVRFFAYPQPETTYYDEEEDYRQNIEGYHSSEDDLNQLPV